MAKELSHLKFEKEQVETMMDIELQNAQDTISALEQEMPKNRISGKRVSGSVGGEEGLGTRAGGARPADSCFAG